VTFSRNGGFSATVSADAFVTLSTSGSGPIRDKSFVEQFPEWGSFAPGVAPVLAISASYVLAGVVGHGVMRLVAGPAQESHLARRPWETAEPSTSTDPAHYVEFWDFKAFRGGPGN
jgi:hypothetical protein